MLRLRLSLKLTKYSATTVHRSKSNSNQLKGEPSGLIKIMSKSNAFTIRYETPLRHLFDKSELNVYDKAVTNLSVGAPGPDMLQNCCAIFEKATNHRMDIESKTNSILFQYGPTVGGYETRVELASFLSNSYKDKVYSEDLVITTGATSGMHLILSTLVDMNGVIFVDDVTYMVALEAFKQFSNMKVIPVKLNENGVDIDYLEGALKENQFLSKTKMFWGMYYAIPTFHNPTGILFSEEICKKLVKLARKYDILVGCDDVYNMLYYKLDESPRRLFYYDNIDEIGFKGNVISNGTFSKIIAPGIRLGWMECPPRCTALFKKSGILQSGGTTNNYTAGIVTSLLQMGLAQSHINMMTSNYKERMLSMCNILKENLPKECEFIEPAGGYFVWIKLPEGVDGNLFNEYCLEKYKICGIVGSLFSIERKFSNYMRMSIAFHSKEVLAASAQKFCEAVKLFCNLK